MPSIRKQPHVSELALYQLLKSHFARITFTLLGTIAVTWALLWAILIYESPHLHPRLSKEEFHFLSSAVITEKVYILVIQYHFIVHYHYQQFLSRSVPALTPSHRSHSLLYLDQ